MSILKMAKQHTLTIQNNLNHVAVYNFDSMPGLTKEYARGVILM